MQVRKCGGISALLAAMAVAIACMATPLMAVVTGNLLTDPGFNTPLTNPFQGLGTVLGPPYNNNVWAPENGTAVASGSGIVPLEGNGMIEMNDDGLVATQTLQGIDLAPYAVDIAAGITTLNMSAYFNVPSGVSTGLGSVIVQFYDSSNAVTGSLVSVSNSPNPFDTNTQSWEQISIVGTPVPMNAARVVCQVAFNNASMGGHPGYVDAAYLSLGEVPEPGVAVALAGLGMTLLRRRK
jgi:hypothetical protein